jgi:nucleoside-diphosphate-sugar epimerase
MTGYIQGAVDGTINIVRQAQKAGISRLIVTSSIASVSNPRKSFTDKGALPVTLFPPFIPELTLLFFRLEPGDERGSAER